MIPSNLTRHKHENFPQKQNFLWLKQVGGVDSQSLVHSDSTELHTQDPTDQDELRSYDPYLIAYHKESNTFTYNDPWAKVEESNSSCSDDSETNLVAEANVSTNELSTAHASVQDSNGCEEIENSAAPCNGIEMQTIVIHCAEVLTEPEVKIEHVAEVSFPLNTIKKR